MIISDAHRFAFVHIPKCAGTSMRKALLAIDDNPRQFHAIVDHPAMGRVHLAHLTLAELAAHYPEELAKVRAYRSLAIVRDPVDRFVSAIYQRLREFKKLGQSDIGVDVFTREVDTVIGYLADAPERLPLEYIHFTPQERFVFLDGERMVDELYPLERLDVAARRIEALTGVAIDPGRKENSTTALRFASLRPLVQRLRRPYKAMMPAARHKAIRAWLGRQGLYTSPAAGMIARLTASERRFIDDFYARDRILHTRAAALDI